MVVVKDFKKKHVFNVKNKLENINYLDVIYVLQVIINLSVLIVKNSLKKKNDFFYFINTNNKN